LDKGERVMLEVTSSRFDLNLVTKVLRRGSGELSPHRLAATSTRVASRPERRPLEQRLLHGVDGLILAERSLLPPELLSHPLQRGGECRVGVARMLALSFFGLGALVISTLSKGFIRLISSRLRSSMNRYQHHVPVRAFIS
jgi:hypothetical protein